MASEEVELKDGTKAVIRPIRRDGIDKLLEGISKLSDRSRRMRFLSNWTDYSAEDVRHLVETDGINTVTYVVAILDEDDREIESVAAAHSIRLDPQSEIAEVAVAVLDDWQNRGVGTALLKRLASHARQTGVRKWIAYIASENQPMRHLMLKFGDLRNEEPMNGSVELLIELFE
jgi:acetyltransferase